MHHGDDATTRHSMSALTELAAEGSDGATATTATTARIAERGASPSDDEGGVVASSAPGGSQPAAEGAATRRRRSRRRGIAEGGASSEEDEGNSGSKLAAEGSGGDATAAERGASSDEDEGDGGSELHAAEGSGGDATAAERSASSDEDEDEDDAGGAELGARNFQRHVEDFECEHCGAFVEGDGYTEPLPGVPLVQARYGRVCDSFSFIWNFAASRRLLLNDPTCAVFLLLFLLRVVWLVDVQPGDRAADCAG